MNTAYDEITPGELLTDLALFFALIITWLWPPKE